METKKCAKCGRELPVSEFYKSKVHKDGYQSYCKDCIKENNRTKKSDIKQLLPRDLMHELALRGYYGILHFDQQKEKEMEVDGHKGIFRYTETTDIDITNF